jgi:polar amino acid transport system substrate-binding protein
MNVLWIGILLLFGPPMGLAGVNEKKTIRVVADPWCPHTCAPGSSKPGLLIEALELALVDTNFQLHYETQSWARAIAEAREGKFEIIAGALKEDAPDFLFPKLSLSSQVSCFFTTKGDAWMYKGVPSLSSRSIGMVQGYTYGEPFDSWAKAAKQLVRISGENTAQRLFKMLETKRINTAIEDNSVARYLEKTSRGQEKEWEFVSRGCLSPNPLYWAVSPNAKNGKEIVALLNGKLAKIKGSQEWKKIQDSYLAVH